MKFLFALLFSFLFFLFTTSVVHAQVVINEVHPAPTEGNDWIELLNTSNEHVSLQGWVAEDQLSSPSVIKQLTETASISAQGFLVIEVSNKLNNSGDGVVLKNGSGEVIDSFSYTSSQTGQSWARSPNGFGEFLLQSPTKGMANIDPSPSPQASASPSPSPTAVPTPLPSPSPLPSPTLIPSPTPSPSPTLPQPNNLSLSEIMACPETGESEWVEIYNPDTMFYMLNNWQIKDALGNSRVFSTTISGQSYAVITLSSGIINNEGDVIHLEKPDGQRISSAQLSACHKGKSFIFQDGAWRESATPTKGSANIVSTTTLITDTSGEVSDNEENLQLETENEREMLPEETAPKNQTNSFVSPYKLPDLGLFTSTESASPAGTVLGSHEEEITHFEDPVTPFWYKKYFIFCLGLIGFAGVGWGSFHLYQWYTEQYAQNDFEAV